VIIEDTNERLEQATQKWAECRVELYRAQSEAQTYKQHFEHSQQQYDKLLGQKKSSEVKTGFMAESLLPLTEQFPCDPKSLRFLGAPIDYISFDYENDQITFIECKTGDSQLNENQRKVRDMVENGRVKFVTVRLNEKGIKVK
jgi:predicted Holliday junction resolvase-like endonuclease